MEVVVMPLKKTENTVAQKPARTRKPSTAPRTTARTTARAAIKSEHSVRTMPHTEAQIRERAYYIYLERGDARGDPIADWYQAERELNGTATRARE
jgi:hypothetical protein